MVRVLILVSCVAVFGASQAGASGFATARFGGEHGHPASDSPTSIYFNPAGLALGTGTRIYAEGLFAWRSITYDRPVAAIDNVVDPGQGGGTPSDAVAANSGEAKLLNLIASPFLGAVTDFGVDNLGVGIAFYVPFGGQGSWDKDADFEDNQEFPGAVNGPQRWAAIDGALRSVYLTVGGAYRIPSARLSIGAGINIVRSEISTVRARVADGSDNLVAASGNVAEGRSLVEVDGIDLAFGAGVIWEPTRQLAIGASYQSQPALGEMSLDGVLTNKFGTGPAAAQDVVLLQGLPDIVRVGGRFRPTPELELRLWGDYTRWSVMEDQCLVNALANVQTCSLDADGGFIDSDDDGTPDSSGVIVNIHRGWRDVFGGKVGASYWVQPTLEINGSLAYDGNAVPDETIDPALLDMHKLFVAAGVIWSGVDHLRLALSYTQVFYASRDVEPRMEVQPDPSRAPDGAGKYTQWLGFVTAGVEYLF